MMIPQCWIMSLYTEYTTPRVNLNYGLWVITMCPRRFISCNECTTLVGGVDTECVEAGGTGEASVPSPQFCHESKTAQKIVLILKNKQSYMRWQFIKEDCLMTNKHEKPFHSYYVVRECNTRK